MILDPKELKNLHKDQLGTETEPRFRGRWESIASSGGETPHNMRDLGWAKKIKKKFLGIGYVVRKHSGSRSLEGFVSYTPATKLIIPEC